MELTVYARVKGYIKKLLDIDLEHYKDEQMRRRLDSWLVRVNAPTWEDYYLRLRQDSTELSRFRNYLTINVTEFFRDTERWQHLKLKIVPELLQAMPQVRSDLSGLRVWSAGCSIGAEPFSLAMLLDELAPKKQHYLLGTDLDRGALERARAGGPFLPEEVKTVSPEKKSKYFKKEAPPYFVGEELVRKVTFKEQNLISDTFEENFDLVVCRNVVIYFTGDAKNSLYNKFARALRRGGILFIGGTEIIPHPHEYGLGGHGISFYTRT